MDRSDILPPQRGTERIKPRTTCILLMAIVAAGLQIMECVNFNPDAEAEEVRAECAANGGQIFHCERFGLETTRCIPPTAEPDTERVLSIADPGADAK